MKWCIHNACSVPLFGSTARDQVETLWTADVFNPWITCTIQPHQRPKKKKWPHLKHVLLPNPCKIHWKNWSHTAASCSTKRHRQGENRKMASGSLYLDEIFKSVNSDINSLKKLKPHGGQLFNQTTATGENWKKASSSLYLDELLIQKCKFRHRFTVHS